MDQWRADAAPVPEPAAHLQELSFFLSVYLGKAPGVLWPEHEHPASVAGAAAADLDALADGLTDLTGLRARTLPGPVPECGALTGTATDDLLIHQTVGATAWLLTPPAAGAARPFRCRLRPGEALHVPAGWSWSADAAPEARFLITHLRPTG